MEPAENHAVVLFDGVCNLCNGLVNFLIDRDKEAYFRLAALQSDEGKALLGEHSLSSEALDSLILIEKGQVYQRSSAALRVVRRFGGAWRLLYGLILVPRPVRDRVYDWVAENRYSWFGRRDRCRRPTPELEERFLG